MSKSTNESINWADSVQRARLIERVGVQEYNRFLAKHRQESIIDVVNGHAIRPEPSRFGTVYMVGDTGTGFTTLEAAKRDASALPKGRDTKI